MSSPNRSLLSDKASEDSYLWLPAAVRDYVAHLNLFSRNARLYLAGSFLISINFAVFQLLFNLYLREHDFAEGAIGSVLSSRAMGMTLVAIPAALLLSKVRLKGVLIVSTILFSLFSFGQTQVLNLRFLQLFGLAIGISFAFYRVASAPFFMRNSTRTERTYLFSFSFGMMILANMAGSAGSGNLVALIENWTGDIFTGYLYTLYLGIGAGMLALIPFSLIKSSKPSHEENRINLSIEQLRRRGKFYLKISSSNLLIGIGAGLVIPFLNIFFRDRFDLPPEEIGWYYFIVSCSMFVGILAGPVLTKRIGLVRTIVVTQFASIPFMLVLAYSYFLPIVVIAFVVRAGLMNLGVPISTNFGMEMSEKNEQGLVNALLMVSWTGGQMLSMSVGGFVIEKFGYTFAINIAVILYILSSIVYFSFFKSSERKVDGVKGWVLPARGEV